ncbi:HNH endonuclease [Serratia fonticola]
MELLRLLDRPIAFQRSFVRLGAGIPGALFLSQAVYWNARTTDPEGWFFKTQSEWEEETGLKRSEQEKARKSLVSIGVLEESKKGLPAKLYYRINEDKLALALQGELQKVELGDVLFIFASTLNSMSKTGYMRALNVGAKAEYVDYADVLKAHGMTCTCCGQPIVYGPGKKTQCLSFDHVIPLAKAGSHSFENLRPAHFGCNSSKGDKTEANKDAYTKQTGQPTQGKQNSLGKANNHTEITTETTADIADGVSADADHPDDMPKSDRIDYQAILDAYHVNLPEMPQVRILTDARKRTLKNFWKKFKFDAKRWEAYLQYIAVHCRWMLEDRPNGTGGFWKRKNLDYLITERCYVAVKEERANDR